MIPIDKKFKYKKANIKFSWNEPKEGEDETTICVTWDFITNSDKQETHYYNRTASQIDSFYIPLLKIIKGYDSMSNALLYVNDEYSKGIYLRLMEQGVDFLSITGIKIEEDGKWRLE